MAVIQRRSLVLKHLIESSPPKLPVNSMVTSV